MTKLDEHVLLDKKTQKKQKEKNMKRNFFALSLGVLLVLSLCACGGGPSTERDANTITDATDTKDNTASKSAASTGNFDVEIKGASKGKDYDGNDVLIVDITWTNNYTDAQMASIVLDVKGYKDGIEMDQAYVMQDEGIDIDAKDKNVHPGSTQDVVYAFILSGDESEVTVEAGEWLGSGDVATKTFTISNGSVL